MGSARECDACQHVQVVRIIPNGRSGYADPHERCGKCGKVGGFHFVPGVHAKTQDMVRDMHARIDATRTLRAKYEGVQPPE